MKKLAFHSSMIISIALVGFFGSCNPSYEDASTDSIDCEGYLIDNFKDKNPLADHYVEIIYDAARGDGEQILTNDITDANGFFELKGEYKVGFFNLDSWDKVVVYPNAKKEEVLGEFWLTYPDENFDFKELLIDTLSLNHKVWLKPRIIDLGNVDADKIEIWFSNGELTDTSASHSIYNIPIREMQTFDPVEIIMTMNTQHWLAYGSRQFASGTLYKNGERVGGGDFKLKQSRPTIEGDTLYLDFHFQD